MDLDTATMTEQVSLREELEAVGIEEILTQLDRELIGLRPVKTRIREVASLLLIERIRKRMNLSTEVPTLHMSFTGNPGTGKTTVALRIAGILHRLGFVRRGHVVSVTRDELWINSSPAIPASAPASPTTSIFRTIPRTSCLLSPN